MATTTSHVLNGLMWNGPNSWFGSTGRITPLRNRNLAKVRISRGGDARSQLLQGGLQIQQQQARHAQRCRNPEVAVADQCAHQKRGQPRHLRGYAGRVRLAPACASTTAAENRRRPESQSQPAAVARLTLSPANSRSVRSAERCAPRRRRRNLPTPLCSSRSSPIRNDRNKTRTILTASGGSCW